MKANGSVGPMGWESRTKSMHLVGLEGKSQVDGLKVFLTGVVTRAIRQTRRANDAFVRDDGSASRARVHV